VIGTVVNATHTLHVGFWHPMNQLESDVPEGELPAEFALAHGEANPGCALGSMVYAVPKASRVTIRLFDVSGREVQTLVDGEVEPGYHSADLRAGGLAGGIYFCRMEAEDFSTTLKLVLLR
jgi:hypothetical protein